MSSGKNFNKAVKYAAMAVKIRAAVIEGMTPAIPYLLRFNLSDYTYFIEYMRARCLSEIYSSGLYEAYVGSCKELAAHLKYAMPESAQTPAAWTSVTADQIVQYKNTLEQVRFAEGGTRPERVPEEEWLDDSEAWVVPWGKTDVDPSGKTLTEMFESETFSRQQIVVYTWLNRPNAEEEGVQQEYGSIDLSMDPSLDDPDAPASPGAGKKTPYMLSNYYSNVFPIKQHRLAMAVEEKGFWAKVRDLPLLTLNGVPMTPDQALEGALQSMCINLDAMGNMHKKLKAEAYKPSRVFDEGAFSFPSIPKPGDLKGENLLDAIIVIETTAFINKIKASKEDPEQDWDFPLDYGYKFFKDLVPKPMPEFIIEQMESTLGAVFPVLGAAVARFWRNPERLMYVPVIDQKGQFFSASKSALGQEALLGNFPWYTKGFLDDGSLDETEAEEMVAKLAYSHGGTNSGATGCPIISETTQIDGPKDKYNGGALFHIRQLKNDDYDADAGRWMLQYYCKVDTDLWERVHPEDDPLHPEKSLQTLETPGFRNLLFLFNGRGPNLRGAVNPHYWNAAMNAFFTNLQQKVDNTDSVLTFTSEDLQKFKNRLAGHYAEVRMGLRLCWWQPSGMPLVEEGIQKFPATSVPEGWDSGQPVPPEIYKWWTQDQYGKADLIKAYQEIESNPALAKKMREKFLADKAHAYVINHVQEPLYHDVDGDGIHPPILLTPFDQVKFVPEYAFCFPICEVLTDDPVTLDAPLLGTGNWQIMEPDLDISDIWNPDTAINKLIKKMGKDNEFKILFDYIFPIGSIIPEIATIYGMEFWKPVADYMKVRKQYFKGARDASDTMMMTLEQQGNYDFDGTESEDPPIGTLTNM